MDYRTLVVFYKNNYELKVYATKLFSPSSNCYLMYVYNYKEEISNFVSTF